MKERFLSAAVVLSVIVLAACAGPRLKVGVTEEGEVVEAEGLVPYIEKDLPATKDAALATAQRSAVEKVVGVYVSARTRVSKAVAIQQRILADTAGYVKRYEVIDEGREDRYYKLKIRALVSFERVARDLKSFGLMDVQDIGSPRVAVLIDESVDGKAAGSAHAATGVTKALMAGGFTVVDKAALSGARVGKGDVTGASELGTKLGVELVVLGDAEAERVQPHPNFSGFSSYRARVAAKAVRSGTSQVVASGEHRASGLDISPSAAASKALKDTGEVLGDELRVGIVDVLSSRSDIRLVATGLRDMEELKRLLAELGAVPGVDAVFLRGYAKGRAEISINAAPLTGGDVAGKLDSLRAPSVRVTNASTSAIAVEIVR